MWHLDFANAYLQLEVPKEDVIRFCSPSCKGIRAGSTDCLQIPKAIEPERFPAHSASVVCTARLAFDRLLTLLELGLAKARSDCVDGDGAGTPNNQDQFQSPPASPVSSSYSPLPSPDRDDEDEPQPVVSEPGPSTLLPPLASSSDLSASSGSSVSTEW